MAFPLIPIVLGGSLVATIHSTWKSRKWQKIHNEALDNCRKTEAKAKAVAGEFNQKAETLGEIRVSGMESLKDAAEFLKKAEVKHREFDTQPMTPTETLDHWQELHFEGVKSLGYGTAGIAGAVGGAAAATAGLYRAAGIFGIASTGVRISELSGTAAHSAKLAWLGRGAISAGGTGMAGGLSRLALAANIVAVPIGIAAAAWGEWKAEQTKRKVESALEEFAEAEAKIRKQIGIMQAAESWIAELGHGINEHREALKNQLLKSDDGKAEDAHKVFKIAISLAELLEQSVLTEDQREVLGG